MIKLLALLVLTVFITSCSKNIDTKINKTCLEKTCLENQICLMYQENATCICKQGYTGESCEININDCKNNECQNRSLCKDKLNSYACECKKGFKGKYCEVDINECETKNCENDSVCRNYIGYAICSCQPGFDGENCENNIDECKKNLCQNQSECIDGINSFTCECKDRFYGERCEIDERSFNDYSLGESHTCEINKGDLYCWGNNRNGQLGTEDNYIKNIAQRVGNYQDWTKIVSSNNFNCAIRKNKLYCWGDNEYGQLGNGNNESQNTPQQVDDDNWQDIFLKNNYACGIKLGKLFCWGNNEHGQLGIGSEINQNIPQRVGLKANWEKIILAKNHVCGIESNNLYCWGDNKYGQLGIGNEISQNTPKKVVSSLSWNKVAVSEISTCGISNKYLYCWGAKVKNVSSNDRTKGVYLENNNIPKRVDEDNAWKDISMGELYTCGTKWINLYCWGKLAEPELNSSGYKVFFAQETPEQVDSFVTPSSFTVKGNYINNYAIVYKTLVVWKNVEGGGALGIGAEIPPNWESIKQKNHICGKNDGKLYCWGNNENGQLGLGNFDEAEIPMEVIKD